MPGYWNAITLPAILPDNATFAADIMLLLTDASLLVHNVNGAEWLRVQPDPLSGYSGTGWSTQYVISRMATPRQNFASGALKDGRVFAIGGITSGGDDISSGEIFDPLVNQWQPISKPSAFDFVSGECNGTVLEDGRVLLGAGSNSGPSSTWSNLTAIWNPAGDWIQAGLENGAVTTTTKGDPFPGETFVLLPDGSVFAPGVADAPAAQRYIPSLDQWVDCAACPVTLAAPAPTTLTAGSAILLPNGSVFAIGNGTQSAIFTPGASVLSAGSWNAGPDSGLLSTPEGSPACLLPGGKVVFISAVSGGYFEGNQVVVYNPASDSPNVKLLDPQPPGGGVFDSPWTVSMLLLPTGQLLWSTQANSAVFLFTPDSDDVVPSQAWRPAIIECPAILFNGQTYTLAGTQLNGLSQAVCHGIFGGMATNYPLVRITNAAGKTYYLPSHTFSTMGVATGKTPQVCEFDVGGVPAGDYQLEVVANGIASVPFSVTVVTPGLTCAELIESVQKQAAAGIRFTVTEGTIVVAQLRECLLQRKITQAQYDQALREITEDDSRP